VSDRQLYLKIIDHCVVGSTAAILNRRRPICQSQCQCQFDYFLFVQSIVSEHRLKPSVR